MIRVGVNVGAISDSVAPFGGVTQSGVGREGDGFAGLGQPLNQTTHKTCNRTCRDGGIPGHEDKSTLNPPTA